MPDDYCFILHALGDHERYPEKVLTLFNSAMPVGGTGKIERGKLFTAVIGSLGKLDRPELEKCLNRMFLKGMATRFLCTRL